MDLKSKMFCYLFTREGHMINTRLVLDYNEKTFNRYGKLTNKMKLGIELLK